MTRLFLPLLAFIALANPLLNAQKLLSPKEFLGYELGERFTPHHLVVAYFQHVDANSDRVVVKQYGRTNELRPLITAFVSTEQNIAKLETFRENNLKRARGEKTTGDEKSIVWLSYNIHGNESNSMEASMKTLYTLASGGMNVNEWLGDVIAVIDPCTNPDGRDRYAQWYNQMLGDRFNANPVAREHQEPWPGGRSNHYYFDLNRDWAWQIQVESQQRNALMQTWLPHVHVDLHEQGVDNPYFFAPAAQPMHEEVTTWQREFQKMIGTNNARYFDKNGWLYFTREVFDMLYPSYGDSYPTYQGAIAMTYEQAGSGRAGLGIWKQEGDTLTLADRLEHHFTASISTLEIGAKTQKRVLEEFGKFFETARNNPAGPYKAYILKAGNNRDKLAALTSWLDRQNIEWGTAGKPAAGKGFDYASGKEGNVSVAADDIVISAYQTKGTLVKVLFEPRTRLVDSLTYDITAWALPYVYGLEAYAFSTRINPADKKLPALKTSAMAERPYAYLLSWQSLEDVAFAGALQQKGFKIRMATLDFEVNGKKYDRGTVIIPRTGHDAMGAAFDETIRKMATEKGRVLDGVTTGMVSSGADFGSGSVAYLPAPKIALVVGEGTSSLSAGELWHYFDHDIDYPVTLVTPSILSGADLDAFNVIVLPSGSYSGMFSESFNEKLRGWLQNGGKLIAVAGAVNTLSRQEKLVSVKRVKSDDETTPKEAEKLDPWGEGERRAVSSEVIGAIFKVQLDKTHPLSFGLNEYYTLRDGSTAYSFLEKGTNVAVLNKDSWRAGFVGAQARAKQVNSLVAGIEPVGRGSIVYLCDNPVFRGFWQHGKMLLANAVFVAGNY